MTRNEAIAVLKANSPDACFSELKEAVDLSIKALEEPERKKGKWDLFIQCSACGYKRKWNGEIFDFCPSCGADMIGEANLKEKVVQE